MPKLYAAAVRLTRRPEDAGDLVQETFLRAYRGFDGFVTGTNARAWLFTILYSTFVNRYHKERRNAETVSLDEVDERLLASHRTTEVPGATSVTVEDLEAAIQDLPHVFRAAIVLVDIEGLTYEEAAGALACPVGTLRSRLSRGRRALFVRLGRPALAGRTREGR
jgi:RNA polymerase sigma-70 factor, ECF subfamily